jgi:hypothetical protein
MVSNMQSVYRARRRRGIRVFAERRREGLRRSGGDDWRTRKVGKRLAMKLKTAMYAALGFVTYKAGKVYAKRKGRQALRAKQ